MIYYVYIMHVPNTYVPRSLGDQETHIAETCTSDLKEAEAIQEQYESSGKFMVVIDGFCQGEWVKDDVPEDPMGNISDDGVPRVWP